MQALFRSAAIDSMAAMPIMAVMMVIASRRDAIGKFAAPFALRLFGRAATMVMASAAVAMFVV